MLGWIPRALFAVSLYLPLSLSASDENADRVRIHGSGVLGAQLVPALVRGWMADIGYGAISTRTIDATRIEIRGVRDGEPLIVEIESRGTTAGFADLIANKAEICMSTRRPTLEEKKAAWLLGDLTGSEQEWVAAFESQSVVVAPGNPSTTISLSQLKSVLSGQTRNWRALGGSEAPIHLHRGRGANAEEPLLAASAGAGGRAAPPEVFEHANDAEAVAALAADPNGIAIIASATHAGAAKVLAIDAGARAIAPDPLLIATEDYPLQRRLYFHTGQLVTALGRGFLTWALSDAGQAVVRDSGFAAVGIGAPERRVPPEASADYAKTVERATRLPTTLRFATQGLDLFDSRARADLDRITALMKRPENAGRKLVVIAFTNPDPRDPLETLWRSERRAELVASELRRMDNRVILVRGLGGELPVADPQQPDARARNERAEIWVQ